MSFEHPLVLGVGMPLLLAGWIFLRSRRHSSAILFSIAVDGGAVFSSPSPSPHFMRFLSLLRAIGFVCLLLAASGPVLLHRELVYLGRGAEILFVLDTSPSMSAKDMEGQRRFDAALRLLRDFAADRPNDAIGLVCLGSEAALMVPATLDRSVLNARLDTLKIGELGDDTALGAGLAIAALHLHHSSSPLKAVVLLTDGESNAGAVHPQTAATILAQSEVRLWVIGLGSKGMVPLEYRDPVSGELKAGLYQSGFDSTALRAIAEAADGTYIEAPSLEAFEQAFSRFDSTERVSVRFREDMRKEPLLRYFLLPGLFCVVLPWLHRRVRLREAV
jgi:Ca-activated chloride channel homolog